MLGDVTRRSAAFQAKSSATEKQRLDRVEDRAVVRLPHERWRKEPEDDSDATGAAEGGRSRNRRLIRHGFTDRAKPLN